ncbi:MAG: hypothetical protein AB1640_06370 [bacterium]
MISDGTVKGLRTAVYLKEIADKYGVTKYDELEVAMDEFLAADGPCFLEVVSDREESVYPVIPQGKGYRDMMLEPFMSSLVTG